jgi:hypothetical protein
MLNAGFEWIQNLYAERLEISFVPGGNGQVVNAGGRGDHDVFEQTFRLVLHEMCPVAKTARVHGQNMEGFCQLGDPEFDLGCFHRGVEIPLSVCREGPHPSDPAAIAAGQFLPWFVMLRECRGPSSSTLT